MSPIPQSPAPSVPWPLAQARALPAPTADAMDLYALRLLDQLGPLTGLDTLNALAPLARRFDQPPPLFPLLHSLEERGLIAGSSGLPRRYRITEAGRTEMERLVEELWPTVAERVARLDEALETVFEQHLRFSGRS